MPQNTPLTLPLWAWQPNYNNSLNSWPVLPLLQPLLYLQYLYLFLLSAVLPQSQLLHLNSKQGKNFSLPQTSPVNKVPVEPSLTLVCYICTWFQSSLAVTRRKSSGPLLFSKIDRLQGGPRTSFARRQTLASFLFNPGPTLNNSSRVNFFWST